MTLSRLLAFFPPLRAATGRGRASGHPLRSHCLLLVLLLLALPLQFSLHVLSHAAHSAPLHDAVAASAEGASAVAAGQEAMLGSGAVAGPVAGPAAGYGAEQGSQPGAALGFEQGAEHGLEHSASGHGAERSPEHGSGLVHQCDQCSGGPLAPGAAFNLAAAQPLSSPPALVGHSLLDRRTTAVYHSRAPPRS